MKTLLLGGAFTLALIASPVSAQQLQVDLGGSAGQSCYAAAVEGRNDLGAIADCTNALGQPMTTADRAGTLVNRGIILMHAGKLDLAVRDYDQAIAMDPAQAEAWLNKAVTMVNSGHGSTALDLVDHALQLRTQKPALAYYVRGLAHEEQGQVRAAYADLRSAASLDPSWQEPAEQLKRYRVVQP